MTDRLASHHKKSNNDVPPIVYSLLHTKHNYEIIFSAANACSRNYSFPDFVEHKEPVPFFDFDFICATLRVVKAASLLESETPVTKEFSSNFFGPHTIRQLVQRIDKYAIPFGAEHELLRRKQKLSNDLSDVGKCVLQRYEKACNMKNPVREVWNLKETQNLSKVVVEELEQICDTYDDIEFLTSVLDHATPIRSLAGKEPEGVYEAYDLALKALSNVRRGQGQIPLNVNDAINIGILVWVYRSPVLSEKKPPIPFMVSDAPSLKDFASLQRKLFLPDELRLFNSRQYLAISEYLHNYGEGRIGIITTESQVLAREIAIVIQAIDRVLTSIYTGKLPDDRLDSPEWNLLRNVARRFQEKWSSLLDLERRSGEHDSSSIRNVLLAPQFKKLLEQGMDGKSDHEINEVINKVYNQLRHVTEENKQLQELLLRPVHLVELDLYRRVESLFQFGLMRNEDEFKYSLLKSNKIVDLLRGIREGWKASNGGHLEILRRFLPNCGPILAIDLETTKETTLANQGIWIRWEHTCSVSDLWKEGLSLVRGLSKAEENDICSYQFFSPSLETEKKGKFYDLQKSDAPTEVSFTNVDHLEISKGNTVWSADVEPRGGTEAQAGLNVIFSTLTQESIRMIAHTIKKTSRHELRVTDFCDIFLYLQQKVFTPEIKKD